MQVHSDDIAVPIVSVVMVFGMIMVAIIAKVMRKIRVSQMIHQERMAAIEKGLPLPSVQDYAATSERPIGSIYNLRRGLLFAFVGLGLLVSSRFVDWGHHGDKVPFLAGGIICVCVGAAYLIFYFVQGRKPESSQSAPEMK
jgi:hypothetical protein